MKQRFLLSMVSILTLAGCSLQDNSNESLFEQWKTRNFETDTYLYVPQVIPEELRGYEVSTTYTSQMQNAVIFKHPEIYGWYVFTFLGQEKENASLDITVNSGEIEVKIQNLETGKNTKSDIHSLKAGETRHFQLNEYYTTDSATDDVQILVISPLSEYAILDYKIDL